MKKLWELLTTIYFGTLETISQLVLYISHSPSILYDKPNGRKGEYPSLGRLTFVLIVGLHLIKWEPLEGGYLTIAIIALGYILTGKVVVPLVKGRGKLQEYIKKALDKINKEPEVDAEAESDD